MTDQNIRKIIREEVRQKVLIEVYKRKIEHVVTESIINEDIAGFLGSGVQYVQDNIMSASTDALKQYVIKFIFNYLERQGFPIKADSLLGVILINVIENLTASDMKDYFSEGGCEKVADRIIMGLQEGLQERVVIDTILRTLVGVPDASLDGGIGANIRELINIKLLEMTKSLRDPFVDFACNHKDFQKLKDDLLSGSKKGSVSGEKVPSTGGAKPKPRNLVKIAGRNSP